jgi:hypothetical protein
MAEEGGSSARDPSGSHDRGPESRVSRLGWPPGGREVDAAPRERRGHKVPPVARRPGPTSGSITMGRR